MKRHLISSLLVMVAAVAVLSAAPEFKSVWRSPEAAKVSFAGKKVAALVITKDDSLRMSGEESLVRELTARGMQAVATYRTLIDDFLAQRHLLVARADHLGAVDNADLSQSTNNRAGSFTP